MSDAKLTIDDDGYYDISFVNGDIDITEGMETALLLSIFCEVRADVSEVVTPELRRGWWGNLVLGYDNYQMGSKLWLLEQARRDNSVLNLSKTFVANALQWLVDDNLAKEIKVDSSFIVNGIKIDTQILTTQNRMVGSSFELWNNTNLF